jgi:hypothetical protein
LAFSIKKRPEPWGKHQFLRPSKCLAISPPFQFPLCKNKPFIVPSLHPTLVKPKRHNCHSVGFRLLIGWFLFDENASVWVYDSIHLKTIHLCKNKIRVRKGNVVIGGGGGGAALPLMCILPKKSLGFFLPFALLFGA